MTTVSEEVETNTMTEGELGQDISTAIYHYTYCDMYAATGWISKRFRGSCMEHHTWLNPFE
jgi:hypothetical protein